MLIINTIHKYRLYLYILLFTFTFIFSSLDKFPFLSGVDDKLQFLQHSEISFGNYEKYQFIRNHIDKINLNCGDLPYVHCGQWFRVRASSFLNYLYTAKIYFLFDRFLKNKNNLKYSENEIDLKLIEISKKYNYSIIFSYLIILLLFILFLYKLDKLSSFFIFIFIFSILITNNHLLNFNLNYFSEFFHKNPKWGTLTELQPKGILVFFILASLIFYINSSYKLFFISIILMIFIHWGQALFVQLFFVFVFLLTLLSEFIFEKKFKIKYLLITVTIFILSYFFINLSYVSENSIGEFFIDFISYFFSLNFIFINFDRILFYIVIISFVFYFIYKIKNSRKNNFNLYLYNFLILGLSSVIFLELLFYFNQYNSQFSENEFSLIYHRVLGNIYFIEFAFLFVLLIIVIYYFSFLLNDLFFNNKLNIKFSYLLTLFTFLIFFEFIINATSISGLKQNYENSKILTNKFSISYFQKIKYKIQNIPYEFFFSICGEKIISFDKNVINRCKENKNYKLINRYLNLDNKLLSNEIRNFNIDTKRPYVYIIQLNSWYKQ